MANRNTDSVFLHLLRCGVTGEQPCEALLPLSEQQWQAVWQTAQQQAVSAVVFSAVARLPYALRPDNRGIFVPWLSETYSTKTTGEHHTQICQRICQKFLSAGFKACILKGQGVALLYPDPTLRMSGDIDVWLWPEDIPMGREASLRRRSRRCLDYVRRYDAHVEPVYHHVDFHVLRHTNIEVHFTPSWMYAPRRNRWLQRWFEAQAAEQFGHTADGFCAPTPSFNAVYLLLHIYRHFFSEGVGLRQLTDYYCLLHRWQPTAEEAAAIADAFRHLGLRRFAGALMYVLGDIFGLERARMLVAPDERAGTMLLSEVMLSGNFGHSDTRFKHYADGTAGAYFTRVRRNLRFVRYYPSEVLWAPLWKLWHFVWRIAHRG